jgi:RimJ/RimL family protein N-acetyltransferase
MIDPQPATLEGHGVRLEPLAPQHHDGLASAAADGELWNLFFTFVPTPAATAKYIEDALAGQRAGHMLPWAVRDQESDRVIGSTRYHDILPAVDRVEIGYTWYAAGFQRSHVNTTCKLLLLEYAFETIGCGVVGLRTDGLNLRSQRAIEAIGAKKDGVLRNHSLRADGSVRDDVMYSILLNEWPGVRKHLETRLWRHGRRA